MVISHVVIEVDPAVYYMKGNALILPATQVEPSHIGAATFDDLQDLINNTMSAGRTSGGLIEASSAAGNVKVNLGTGFIKITDSP
ncbi:unnamed protein product, partial [marine sediment metagenome]